MGPYLKTGMTDKKDQKDHIIHVAIELFAEKGFEGTSIRDLATKADVNVAMVNYYFGSKEGLFASMVEKKASYTRGILDEIINNKSLSAIEKIEHIIDSYVMRLFHNRKFHRVIHQEMMLSKRENLQQTIVDFLFPNSVLIKEVLESGMKKGEFRKIDAPLVIATLIGTINQVLLSKKMCNRLLSKGDDYVPYDDPKFIKRVGDHLKQLIRSYLLPA